MRNLYANTTMVHFDMAIHEVKKLKACCAEQSIEILEPDEQAISGI
jgi:hypothetical protein